MNKDRRLRYVHADKFCRFMEAKRFCFGLESPVNFINDLVITNPVGASDPKSEGDDHIRNIKTAIKAVFPNMAAAAACWRGALAGLTLSNNGTATKLDVAAGACRDSTNVADIILSSAITAGLIQTSGSWAAGSTQNKLDTGARANSTWYHVWAIRKDSDGTGDWLFSLSASAPTMPAGYTYNRRIGSVLTDSSGNITAFTQTGNMFHWSVSVRDINVSNQGNTSVLYTLSVPTGVKVEAMFNLVTSHASNLVAVLLSPPDVSDEAVSASHSSSNSFASVAGSVAGNYRFLTNTSAQIRARADTANTVLSGYTYGWVDRRGQDS